MITIAGEAVRVLDADVRAREATVQWESGRVRLVSMLRLRGSEGGELEVVTVCKEAEAREERLESARTWTARPYRDRLGKEAREAH